VDFSAEVLPVVGIDTGIAWVVLIFLITEWTPHGLKMEQIKVDIPFHSMQIIYRELIFMVSERAHFTKLARVQVVWVRLAELRFVLLGMVKVFDGIVRSRAVVTQGAVVCIVAQS
jgi:hypothetical protein